MTSTASERTITPDNARRISEAWNKSGSKGSGHQWYGCCPVHNDDNPSMSIKWHAGKTGNGDIMFYCHSGCDFKDIYKCAVDQGLLPKWVPQRSNNGNRATIEFWENKGLIPVEGYRYQDENGILLFEKWRFTDPAIKNKKEFRQRKADSSGNFVAWNLDGVRRVLYNLPEVVKGIKTGATIFILEGEKDVNKARLDGLIATCNFDGAGKWKDEDSSLLKDAKRIVLIADNDWAGYQHLNIVGESLKKFNKPLDWLIMPGAEEKGDYSDWRALFEAVDFPYALEMALPWIEKVANPFPSPKEKQAAQQPKRDAEGNVVYIHREAKKSADVVDGIFLERWTDTGNGARFKELFGDDVRHSQSRGWLVWDGQRFVVDEQNSVKEMAKQTARAVAEESGAGAKKLGKWLQKTLDETGLNNMLKNAKSLDGIRVDIKNFDKDPNILNTLDGVVDLKTGKLQKHDRKFLCTQITNCGYNEKAFEIFTFDNPDTYWESMPLFMNMMKWICGDDIEKLHYLQEVAGYSMSGLTIVQEAWLCEGFGRNLKSTWIDCLREMLGSYATTIPADMFMRRQGAVGENHMFNFSQLLGVRLAAVQEINSGDCLDEAKFKTCTGNTDEITARFLRFEPFKFRNTAKFIFRANHLPRIRNQDDGVWRRMRRVPFHTQVPEGKVIGNFDEHLRGEWPTICAFYARGLVRLLQRGRMIKPQCVEKMDAEFRQSEDTIGWMLNECFEIDESSLLPAAEMQRVHGSFCDRYNQKQLGAVELARRLAQKKVDLTVIDGCRYFVGYKVATDYETKTATRYSSRTKDYD